MAAIPFPPMPFPNPVILAAQRDFRIDLEDGRTVDAYLRCRDLAHAAFAYERFPHKLIDLGAKGKILYGQLYQRLDHSERELYRETGHLVVIKKLSRAWIHQRQVRVENHLSEIAVAQHFAHDNHVVPMYEALQDGRYFYMVMPYFGCDLHDAMRSDSDVNLNHVRLLQTLVQNLLYLQQHRIIHRDFSPENVIVCRQLGDTRCPLIDFAMALQCATLEGNTLPIAPQEIACGKFPYMSPEVARGQALDFGVDVWALGCTLFLLWTGTPLYDQPGDRSFQIYITYNGIADPDQFDYDAFMSNPDLPPDFLDAMAKLPLVQALSDEQRDLLSRIFTVEPTERIRAEQILQHDYIQSHFEQ